MSKGQFRRALDQAGLTAPAIGAPPSDLLSAKEVEVLSKRYEVKPDGRGGTGVGVGGEPEINYWKLCEQIEKVRGREKTTVAPVRENARECERALSTAGVQRTDAVHVRPHPFPRRKRVQSDGQT